MDEAARVRDHGTVLLRLRRRLPPGWPAWLLLAGQGLLVPFTYFLGLSARGTLSPLLQFGWWETFAPLFAFEFTLVGALIVRRHPRHAVGWLAVAGGFSTGLSVFAGAYTAYSTTHGEVLPGTWAALWLRSWLWYVGLTFLFVLLPALFPDGCLPSRRWRPLVWAVVVGCAAQILVASVTQVMYGFPRADGPYPGLGWLLDPLTPLSGLVFFGGLFAAVGTLWVRFRRSGPDARQQIKWFGATVTLQAALWGASQSTGALAPAAYQHPYFEVLIPVALLLVPASIGLAILRHRLYDIDLVISRGLSYAGMAAFITAAYLLVVVGAGLALGTGGRPNLPLSVVAMAVVALLIQPVRLRLERLANRLVYGIPADPYAILAEISRTPAGGDVEVALRRIAQAVARGVGGRQVRVRLRLPGGQDRSSTWPVDAGGPFERSFAVTHDGETVGEIEAEASGDAALTDALLGQAGLALRTLRLSADLAGRLVELEAQAHELAASRTRLVQAEEAERRRLERDLHDGIQQELVVLIAKARLARNQLARDPAVASETLAELQVGAQHALADLRALARGIHPAVLTSRGLFEAIESIAARSPVDVRVEAEGPLRDARYAPEIEGAAYFVAAEGLANVLKHSGASRVTVGIACVGPCLRLVITDDGRGFDPSRVRESGLRGLRDRVEALGGHLEVDSQAPGTRLEMSLPITESVHA